MKKVYGLNIIKILATIIIVFHHYQQMFGFWLEGKINFNNGSFYFGYVTELFFIVSGFLAYNSLVSKNYDLGKFTDFIKVKFFRFFPMCFLSLTFLFLMQWIMYFSTGSAIFWGPPTFIDYILSVLFLDTGWGFEGYIVATHITWYISVLMMAYVVFWCVCYLSRELKLSISYTSLVLIIGGIMLAIREDLLFEKYYPIINRQFGRGLAGFFIGVLVYILIHEYEKIMKIYSCIGGPVVCISLFYDYSKTGGINGPVLGSAYLCLMLVLYPSILTVFTTSKWIEKLSSLKIMDYLEKVSFSVYLWHINVILIIYAVLEKTGITVNYGYKSMITFAIFMFIIGTGIYKFVEKPITRMVSYKK